MSIFSDKVCEILNRSEEDNAKFEKGNRSAGVRARKALMEIKKLAGEARKKIGASKAEETAA